MNKNIVKRGLLPYVFLLIFLFGIMFLFTSLNREVHEYSYGEFTEAVQHKKDIDNTMYIHVYV